jgi:methylated-DNA-[protein]-cysteine S-methyltransferase
MLYTTTYDSPVGKLTIASDGKALTGLWLEDQKYFGDTLIGEVEPNDTLPLFKKTKKWLDRYFTGKKPAIDELPLNPRGTPFRKEVWEALCQIPYGKTVTYMDLAKAISARRKDGRTSARAVGGAVGHNPISVIIPCHRVVGSDGSLTGYSGGLDRKHFLLKLEGALD